MTSLRELIDSTKTDKDTAHTYLPMYESLLSKYRDTAMRVMEIGVFHGGSILMWQKYFTKAEIHARDVADMPECLAGVERVFFHKGDAYNEESTSPEDVKYDVIIDDGPHTLESFVKFINIYLKRLAPGGIAIIEDIQSPDWIPVLYSCLPSNEHRLNSFVIDMRLSKKRHDDLVFVIKAV